MNNEAFTVETETSFSSDPPDATTNDVKKTDDVNAKPPEYEVIDMDKSAEKGNSTVETPDLKSVEPPPGVADKPYADMGKEDLLRFSDTPFWQRFRLVSILLFWAAWLALLGAVIGLTIVAPRCDDQPTPKWWQRSVIYQVYVRSFFDFDGDGVGDIQGVQAKMEYLKNLQVDAILLSSVFHSEHQRYSDYGYEIINHTHIDPVYGTVDAMRELISAAHNESIKVLIDFVPNHTGLKHQWFVESQTSGDYTNPYWNYYVWAKCTASSSPNNWLSVYNQSAWEFDATRNECYLHQFLKSQPELNLRSAAVQEELEKILRYWLDLGVDGLRVVNSAFLFEDPDFRNETWNTSCSGDNRYDCLDHSKTRSLPEGYDIVARWREIVDEYTHENKDHPRVILTDADVAVDHVIRYYGNSYGLNGANLAINYGLTQLTSSTLSHLYRVVREWLDIIPGQATSNWLTGDQDRSRLASYVNDPRFVKALHLVKMTLPGAAFVYYGEEIGLTNVEILDDQRHDPAGNISLSFSRDGYRTPMHWNHTSNGGFVNNDDGTKSTWLPVGNTSINVASQVDDADSTLEFVRSVIQLRRAHGSIQYGAIHYLYNAEGVFSYIREHEGNDRVLVMVNMGNTRTGRIDLSKSKYAISIPSEADIVLVTNSTQSYKDDTIKLREIYLDPGHGFVATWAFKRSL